MLKISDRVLIGLIVFAFFFTIRAIHAFIKKNNDTALTCAGIILVLGQVIMAVISISRIIGI